MANIRSVKGMHDVLPRDYRIRQIIERKIAHILKHYGYDPILLSLIEHKELFTLGLGTTSAIINKEMYELEDRNGDRLVLRPEGTASCLRAIIEHQLVSQSEALKIWYNGPMFRYERPQKGRYREFYQIGIESFNFDPLLQEAENIMLVWHIWQALGLENNVVLHIHNLGSYQDRERYSEKLVQYMKPFMNVLSMEERNTLLQNPLRILDSKNVNLSHILTQAPKLGECINSIEDKIHFETLIQYLEQQKIPYIIDHKLVRGLDYYSKTVFEWLVSTPEILGSQSTLCAGGRYNDLVKQFTHKQDFNAFGCAIGVERLMLSLCNLKKLATIEVEKIDIYMIVGENDSSLLNYLSLFARLRSLYPQITIKLNPIYKSLKTQLEKAYKIGAHFILELPSEELNIIKVTRVNNRSSIRMDFVELQRFLTQEFMIG